MPGGKRSKTIGDGFEYRVRDWFRNQGWHSERNPLSGASDQLKTLVAKHDVRATKQGVFLQLECKKTNDTKKHKLRREWYDKINFLNDEFLVFGFGRSAIYCCVPLAIYQELDPNMDPTPTHEAKGEKQFTFHRSWFDDTDYVVFHWETYQECYVATLLENWVELLSQRGPLEDMDPVSVICGADEIKFLTNWFNKHHHRLTNEQKCLYYGKLHRLEHNIADIPKHELLAEVQWWRDTTSDFVFKCPHCEETVTQGDLQKPSDNNPEECID